MIRRRKFPAEDDLTFLGVSAITGGAPEIDSRISKAWKAFHAVRRTLVCRSLPLTLRWERWKRHVAPVLG